jgi:hypothetical protein
MTDSILSLRNRAAIALGALSPQYAIVTVVTAVVGDAYQITNGASIWSYTAVTGDTTDTITTGVFNAVLAANGVVVPKCLDASAFYLVGTPLTPVSTGTVPANLTIGTVTTETRTRLLGTYTFGGQSIDAITVLPDGIQGDDYPSEPSTQGLELVVFPNAYTHQNTFGGARRTREVEIILQQFDRGKTTEAGIDQLIAELDVINGSVNRRVPIDNNNYELTSMRIRTECLL